MSSKDEVQVWAEMLVNAPMSDFDFISGKLEGGAISRLNYVDNYVNLVIGFTEIPM